MYLKKYLIVLAVLIFASSSLFAQASANAPVTLSVKPSLSIAIDGGDLDFGQVLTTAAGNETLTPEEGVKFKVDGHKTGTVDVTFGNVTLTSLESNNLQFSPNVVTTGSSSSYSGATPLNSGGSASIVGGTVYIWVGGSINATSAPAGDYTGTFTLSVAY